MCGIIGYNGKQNAIPIIINGLKNLEYRGYDSAGIAYFYKDKIKIIKEKGRISELEKLLDNSESNIAIGHTRWATHGEPSRRNSHPHKVGNVTIVHNGIIENYATLKEKLEQVGYKFQSETDTEVAAAVIDYENKKEKDKLKVLEKIESILKGSYALLIIFQDEPNTIYALREGSPLIVAMNNDGNFIASDIPAILDYTKDYYLLEEKEIAVVKMDNIKFFKEGKEIQKELLTFKYDTSSAKKDGYPYFMLKEIYEQPKVIKNFLDYYLNNMELIPDIGKYHKIHIVACGSAYHAGLIGNYLLEEYGDVEVTTYVASEYRYKKNFLDSKTLVILISQSGETADTIASLRLAKEMRSKTLGIVNVLGSTIAREADEVIFINAGCEIAVATTKAYTLQVLTLSLIAFKLGLKKGITKEDKDELLKDYKNLPEEIEKMLELNYKPYAKKIAKKKNVFFIGRLIDYYISLEGSLKLKEISYIHSETYPAGELKHGTISLIEEGTPVVAIITDKKIASKTISNIKEVKARGAYTLVIKRKEIEVSNDIYDDLIEVENLSDLILSILTIIPLQLLAYHTADTLGYDIDKPRNLAKSVTVE